MSKSKSQGTAWETEIVRRAQAVGLIAERLAEGGAYDLGDVRIFSDGPMAYIIEAKDRANLNLHKALEKARFKSKARYTVVAWKRRVRKGGNVNRTQDGEPVVAMTLDLFLEIIGGRP